MQFYSDTFFKLIDCLHNFRMLFIACRYSHNGILDIFIHLPITDYPIIGSIGAS